ncbi:MAG: hypothetical protein ACI4Q4_07135 [Oscillospiraceae bacterium]
MGTALEELTAQTGKPLCVDRRNSCPKPYRAAEAIPREHTSPDPAPPKPPVLTGKQHMSDKSKPSAQPRETHSATVTRNSTLVLWLAAVSGAAAGMVAARDLGAAGGVLLGSEGSFLALFLSRLAYGASFLLAEYLLGFFALGEWLVWVVPLCCGMGIGLSGAALITSGGAPLLLLPAVLTLFSVILGARCSGEFSEQLLRVVSGSRTGIVLTSDAAKSYTLRFAAYLSLVGFSALVDAAIKLHR